MPPLNPMLQTNRCNLRAPCAENSEQFFALNSNPEVRRYLGGLRSNVQINERFDLFLNSIGSYWVVEQKNDQKFIGIVSLNLHHDGVDTEVSYEFLPAYWGKGFATETVLQVLEYALHELRLPRVVAETQIANEKSIRLLERIGMRFDREVERFGAKQAIYVTTFEPGAA
jgi:[ribosomal protein S5]-alanine N-acetyltransferase